MSSPPDPQPPASAPAGEESTSDLLQSMLSRAVEGQVEDQRELTAAIGDVRTQLMRLSQEFAEMRLRPPQDETSDAQTNAVTVELREAVRFLSERLDGVTRMVAQRGEELADIRTALTAIDAHVRSQAETIGVLSAGLQVLPSYGERVSILQDNLEIVHNQLVGIEESVSTPDGYVGDRLAAIEATVSRPADSGLTERLAAIAGALEPLAEDVTAIGGNVAGLVEGSADGAALDSRITESVSHAVRDTERRLMSHVDDAVLALARTLLKRRVPSTAGQITGTPVAEPPAEPAAEAPVATSGPAAPTEPAEESEPTVPAPWWESNDAVDAPPVEAGGEAVDAPPAEASDDAVDTPLADAGDDPVDAPPADASDDAVDALPADASDDATASVPERTDSEADTEAPDETASTPEEPSDSAPEPPATEAASEAAPATSETWSPEIPPERDPADPTVTLDDGQKRKRRWGRR